MQLTYVAVVVLASMIFVLSGMVGYVYWQQTRMLQNLQSLAVVVSTHFIRQPQSVPESALETEQVVESVAETDTEMPPLVPIQEESKEDDRVSVNELDVVEGPPAVVSTTMAETVDYESKTAAQLRDLLTSKNIPFGKRDAKSVLVQLLKSTA